MNKNIWNKKPYAITMWDFSWIERRYKNGGYENWQKSLDELIERGYDMIRIDAYPHLVSINPYKEWKMVPIWTMNEWGAPFNVEISIQPNLNNFIRLCKERNIKITLSTWFREDIDNSYQFIKTPKDLANAWIKTIQTIDDDLLDNIIYIDLCNEVPIKLYTPFLPENINRNRHEKPMENWMHAVIDFMNDAYPQLGYTFSSAILDSIMQENFDYMDVADMHVWMSSGEFYQKVGYNYERFDDIGYNNVIQYAQDLYESDKKYWQKDLTSKIEYLIEFSKEKNIPLLNTEGWAITDYKDHPKLNWDWVKELCEIGVMYAVDSNRYVAVCTSNFCGPQFKGMWDDIKWHKKLTDYIKSGIVNL